MEQRQEYQDALDYWLLCINLINVHHHHCQVNITNQLGETPLHLAVENVKGSAGDENSPELVQFLVDR